MNDLSAIVRSEFPPLAGIVSSPPRLDREGYLDINPAQLDAVLARTIRSSEILDELFSNSALDFFVILSPLSWIMEPQGSSYQAAAQGFLAALINKRRLRGKAGSILLTGPTTGLPNDEYSNDDSQERVNGGGGVLRTSEADLHYLFAQSIVSGLPGSSESTELITGLCAIWKDDDYQPPWLRNPKFSHAVLPSEKRRKSSAESGTVLSLKARLVAATTTSEAVSALERESSQRRMGLSGISINF